MTPRNLLEASNLSHHSVARLRTIYDTLAKAYGPQSWWPSQSAIETIVGAYLVQNTSWRGVTRSIQNLKDAQALSVGGLIQIPLEQLRTLIRPSGYMIRKSLALKAFVTHLRGKHQGSLQTLADQPTAMIRDELLTLPGIGPETADVILLYALDHPVMVVDEYLRRITARHAIAAPKTGYIALQQLALQAFAHESLEARSAHYNEFHALIVEVGKNHCGPTPRCNNCPLRHLLPDTLPTATPAAIKTRRQTGASHSL